MGNLITSLHWLGHAAFRLSLPDKTIYFDPWKITNAIKADLIFVSHEHYDHFSPEDIQRLIKPGTIIICTAEVDSRLKYKDTIVMKHEDVKDITGIKATAIAAYNIKKRFHPKETGKNGYILDINKERIYHAGDTDATPEMKSLKNISVACVPIGGTYTMTPEEAADAVNVFMPETAVPMHYGDIVGKESDAQEFKRLAKCRVEILKKEG